MLELRRRNRRHRAYKWYKMKVRKRTGFIKKSRRPSIKVH